MTKLRAKFVEMGSSERKCRLFAVACCRESSMFITNPECQQLVDMAEAFADGLISANRLARHRQRVYRWARAQGAIEIAPEDAHAMMVEHARGNGGWEATWAAYQAAVPSIRPPVSGFLVTSEYQPIFNEVFGDSFPTAPCDPNWRTSTAVAIAQTMYDSREFSPMPILADALEDAGCNHPDILAHCRGEGPHVRGCWVVDLVLGKQ